MDWAKVVAQHAGGVGVPLRCMCIAARDSSGGLDGPSASFHLDRISPPTETDAHTGNQEESRRAVIAGLVSREPFLCRLVGGSAPSWQSIIAWCPAATCALALTNGAEDDKGRHGSFFQSQC